jgi:hypothetical protein
VSLPWTRSFVRLAMIYFWPAAVVGSMFTHSNHDIIGGMVGGRRACSCVVGGEFLTTGSGTGTGTKKKEDADTLLLLSIVVTLTAF